MDVASKVGGGAYIPESAISLDNDLLLAERIREL